MHWAGYSFDFYPRPPRGGRLVLAVVVIGNFHFYPRPPRGGRRADKPAHFRRIRISIHALREEGDLCRDQRRQRISISIHALREEGDIIDGECYHDGGNFYPRPPRGGRRWQALYDGATGRFLSTPSARRATSKLVEPLDNPSKFLSTPSARRATQHGRPSFLIGKYFYPRPPRGGRLDIFAIYFASLIFLSTPSARRATCSCTVTPLHAIISIHALREEGDFS